MPVPPGRVQARIRFADGGKPRKTLGELRRTDPKSLAQAAVHGGDGRADLACLLVVGAPVLAQHPGEVVPALRGVLDRVQQLHRRRAQRQHLELGHHRTARGGDIVKVVLVAAVRDRPRLVDQRTQTLQILAARRTEAARDHLEIGGKHAVTHGMTGDHGNQIRRVESPGKRTEAPLRGIHGPRVRTGLGQRVPGEPGAYGSQGRRDHVRAQHGGTAIGAVTPTRQDAPHDADPDLPGPGAVHDIGVGSAETVLQVAHSTGGQQHLAAAVRLRRRSGPDSVGSDAHGHAIIQPSPAELRAPEPRMGESAAKNARYSSCAIRPWCRGAVWTTGDDHELSEARAPAHTDLGERQAASTRLLASLRRSW